MVNGKTPLTPSPGGRGETVPPLCLLLFQKLQGSLCPAVTSLTIMPILSAGPIVPENRLYHLCKPVRWRRAFPLPTDSIRKDRNTDEE